MPKNDNEKYDLIPSAVEFKWAYCADYHLVELPKYVICMHDKNNINFLNFMVIKRH